MKRIVILLAVVVFTLAGCELNQVDPPTEINLTEKAASLLKAENEFGFELFKLVYKTETKHENVMLSPLSVSLALAMTYNGANGETKTAMEKTLKVHGLTPADINQSYADLVKSLQSLDPKVLLEIANAIYYRNDFLVEKSFVATNSKFYDASVSALDFNSPLAVNTINAWVAEKTHNKIKTILDRISPNHVMFLLNAIYFKGAWAKEFNVKSTANLPFYLNANDYLLTATMQRNDTLPYLSNNLFSAVQLSYGKGNYNMYVILPNADKTLSEIVQKMDTGSWNTWSESFSVSKNVDIKIPKLKYGYEIELNDVLTAMGMGIAFTGKADFTGINREGGLNIDYVKHKSFIEVNEEGTEAAAVTIVAIEKMMIDPEKIIFNVNRPYLYIITEKSTGAVLFLGTVKNPSKS